MCKSSYQTIPRCWRVLMDPLVLTPNATRCVPRSCLWITAIAAAAAWAYLRHAHGPWGTAETQNFNGATARNEGQKAFQAKQCCVFCDHGLSWRHRVWREVHPISINGNHIFWLVIAMYLDNAMLRLLLCSTTSQYDSLMPPLGLVSSTCCLPTREHEKVWGVFDQQEMVHGDLIPKALQSSISNSGSCPCTFQKESQNCRS